MTKRITFYLPDFLATKIDLEYARVTYFFKYKGSKQDYMRAVVTAGLDSLMKKNDERVKPKLY